jgi:TM2 domain-containing membrane protein YozV
VTEPGVRRRKTRALILSGIFPGLGQFYNRQPLKAVVFLVVGVVLSWLLGRVAPTDVWALTELGTTPIILLGALLATSVWSVVDAWRVADR